MNSLLARVQESLEELPRGNIGPCLPCDKHERLPAISCTRVDDPRAQGRSRLVSFLGAAVLTAVAYTSPGVFDLEYTASLSCWSAVR